jgi:hypothetical protein
MTFAKIGGDVKNTIYAACLILCLPVAAVADTSGKVKRLMEAQGLLEMWQQQIDMGRIEGKKQADAMLDQLLSKLSPSPEFKERFKVAADKFVAKLQGNWTAEEIVAVWAKYHAPKFTEAELDQLLAFYTSDIGQKEVKANKVTIVEFTRHFQAENQRITKEAVDTYIADLKIIASECNCEKKPGPKD